MKWLFFFTLFAFVGGQLASIVIEPGVRISLLDVSIVLLVSTLAFTNASQKILKKFLSVVGPFIVISVFSLFVALFNFPAEAVLLSSLFLIRWIFYSAVIIAGWHLKKIVNIPKGLFVCGVIVALLGILQYFLYPNLRNISYLGWDPHEFRLFSTFLDPNFTGIILVLTILAGVFLLRSYKNKTWIYISLALSTVALLLTYSRGAFITFTIVFIALMIRLRKYLLLAVFGIVFVVGLFILPKPAGEGVNLLRTISIGARLQDTTDGWNLFLKSPLIGHGFNTIALLKNQPTMPEMSVPQSRSGFSNAYIEILVMTGIVGFLSYLYMWKRLLGSFAEKQIHNISDLKYISLLMLTAVGIHSFFDNSLLYVPVMFWIMLWFGSVTDYT